MKRLSIAAIAAFSMVLAPSAIAQETGSSVQVTKKGDKVCKTKTKKNGDVRRVCVTVKQGPKGDNGAPGAQGPQGPQGEAGTQGVQGPAGSAGANGATGAQGLPGTSGYEVRTYQYKIGGADAGQDGVPAGYGGAGQGAIATVACSSQSKVAVGGGYILGESVDAADENVLRNWSVVASFPGRMDWSVGKPFENRNDGWIVRLNAPQNAAPISMTVYVVCMNAS